MIDLSFYNGKKVFVTGHTGFNGAWLCHVLLHAGAEVTGYALLPPTVPSLFEQTELEKRVHSIIGDIRDRENLMAALYETNPGIVFHLAAQPLVKLSYREPAQTYETNVLGTINILEAVRITPSVCSFVNITTDKVYENKEWYWGYRENENLCGLDPYSNSKSCSELVTYSYSNAFFNDEHSVAISTARSGNVIGGGDYAEDRIISDCIRAALSGKGITLKNPHSIRPYLHVLDCLSGYLLLAEKQYNAMKFAGAYNFGPDEEGCVTTGQITRMFFNIWGGNLSCTTQSSNERQLHEANFLKLDCSKAKSVLNWKPVWDIKTTVEKTIEFAKSENDTARLLCVEDQIKKYFC